MIYSLILIPTMKLVSVNFRLIYFYRQVSLSFKTSFQQWYIKSFLQNFHVSEMLLLIANSRYKTFLSILKLGRSEMSKLCSYNVIFEYFDMESISYKSQ